MALINQSVSPVQSSPVQQSVSQFISFQCVIACVSPKYVVSHHCIKELALADLLHKPIIPVMIDKVAWPPPGGMSLIFSQLVYINLKGKHLRRNMTKSTKWLVRPAKTQIGLGIRPVWSESLLCAQWVAKGPSFLHSLSGQQRLWSDWGDAQADLSLRWAHMPFCWFCHVAAHLFLYSILKYTDWLYNASLGLQLFFVVQRNCDNFYLRNRSALAVNC